MNKQKIWLLLCLVDLPVGTAAMAMPVTQVAGQDVRQREQELWAVQASPLRSQSFRADAGVATATNGPALLELDKQPGDEFAAVLAKSELQPDRSSRGGQRAEQELFGAAAKEGLISAEVKSVLKDLRGELHQLTGDHFRSAQAAGEADQAQVARRLDQAKSSRDGATNSAGQPISEEERRLGAGRVALMTEQFFEEIKPWAITAAVLLVLFQAAQALIRKQAEAKMLRGKMRREVRGEPSRPVLQQAETAQLMPTKSQGERVRQRIRLTSSSSSSSSSSSRRRRLF